MKNAKRWHNSIVNKNFFYVYLNWPFPLAFDWPGLRSMEITALIEATKKKSENDDEINNNKNAIRIHGIRLLFVLAV